MLSPNPHGVGPEHTFIKITKNMGGNNGVFHIDFPRTSATLGRKCQQLFDLREMPVARLIQFLVSR